MQNQQPWQQLGKWESEISSENSKEPYPESPGLQNGHLHCDTQLPQNTNSRNGVRPRPGATLNEQESTNTPSNEESSHSARTTQIDREMKDLTKRQAQQSKYHNNQHTRDLPTLEEGDVIQMKPFQLETNVWKKGIVTSWLDERSYVVEMLDGEILL